MYHMFVKKKRKEKESREPLLYTGAKSKRQPTITIELEGRKKKQKLRP
jgi:hypothetical protein